MIAAPSSGSGKTIVTLGLLRAMRNAGFAVRGAKSGPDYIDPKFHEAACGHASVNLDSWAMRSELIKGLASGDGTLVVEAAMGLFDGAADGSGSAADLSIQLGLPVVLVVDAARQSQSIAALVSGFVNFRSDVQIAGVILNRVGSDRHDSMLRAALAQIEMPVFGSIKRDNRLELPSRHLGLVQAQERSDLEKFMQNSGEIVGNSVNMNALDNLGRDFKGLYEKTSIPPLGQRIAIARDEAFSFVYPHMLESWREQGAELQFFSPLADEAVPNHVDAVFLPGGYPELHAQRLSNASKFHPSLNQAAARSAIIYGECGGYMVLGEALIDADGAPHQMAGLLPVTTSFAERKLSLGYRNARLLSQLGPIPAGSVLAGHEFHYSTVVAQENDRPLFAASDALGQDLGQLGLQRGSVSGSYLHMIDLRPEAA
ncbi:cobyrinate a,c-diamide synthase [Ahrensia sp. R2A130]|uniref:cobyrinate a,c-diamide synthase n=1 Tax=Ahrensia sp. R2A130 TaxID=744979 RepID=UPI00030F661C|nr:cobyrinate a,c-diamide synthase [Ahrensia sp. R2A130]